MRRALTAAAALALGLVAVVAPAASATGSSPWTDPAANGTITFCDQQGHAVTSGRVSDKPFVWEAVGSAPAPAPYSAPGALAELYMFAPIKGSDPSTWAGEAMAGSSNYTDVAHPAAVSTSLDLPLSVFLSDYQLLWDGYIQARLVYSRAGYGAAPQYAAATILVSGGTWQVVGPTGTAPCSSGSAVSSEIKALDLPANGIVPSASAASHGSTSPSASSAGHAAASAAPDPGLSAVEQSSTPSSSSGVGAISVSPSTTSGSDGAGAAVAASAANRVSGSPWIGALMLAVVVALAAGSWFWVQRRRRGAHR